MVTQLSEYAKKQQIVQYKWANLTIRDLYLNKDVKKHELTKLSEGRIVKGGHNNKILQYAVYKRQILHSKAHID